MQWDDLNWDRTTYSAFGAYQQSKLANVLFSAELARRLEGTGVGCSGQSPISSMNIVHISCPFSNFPIFLHIFPFSHFPAHFPIDNHKSPNLCSVSTAHIPVQVTTYALHPGSKISLLCFFLLAPSGALVVIMV